MSEMVKLAGTVEDANKMSRASDQSKPWAETLRLLPRSSLPQRSLRTPPMLEYNARKDAEAKQQHKKVMARFAALKYLGKEHNEIDVDELMGSSSKQCKNDIWRSWPCSIRGCTHSLVNKNFVVTNNFEITPTDGSIHLAADGLTVPRTGSIKDVNVEYSDKNFLIRSRRDSTVIDPEPYEPNNSPAGTNEQRDAFF
ncbi:hypothetical protein O0I10_009356 [Lichtheimia ornata]|uniref:Uncharacterized protein n=1 Tax=Lichtheimia ornata TaxID=688661 RepID=A0AAD7UYN1_9FUNG|nr:uncharacterized protein O0I10_009356 [Lichtheimia ornata]KAJ8654960.1 hypothetical protein O0I10_009356 [Lichtheimia ornata]